MDLELLNSIGMDMKWNVRKKGRTNITRRPRTDDFELGNGIQEPDAFETKKVYIFIMYFDDGFYLL